MKNIKQDNREIKPELDKFIKLHELASIKCWKKSDKIPNAKQFDFKSAWNMFSNLLIKELEIYENKI